MEIINAIPSYLITVTASVAFFVALNILHNFVEHKIATAKTEQAKARWSYTLQLADTAVNSLIGSNLAGNEKFEKATVIVQNQLNKQGFTNVDVKAIEAAIQSAYEKSDLTTKKSATPSKIIANTTTQGITTSIIPESKNLNAMPGTQPKASMKPKNPTNVLAKKGIPTADLKDVAVQTPQPKPQAGDPNVKD